MTRASETLFQAVDGLYQAAEAEFTGNGYYLVASQLTELREILGPDSGSLSHANGVRLNFLSSLEAVRRQADAELLGNRHYLVAHKLDVLALLGSRFSKSEDAVASKTVASEKGPRTFDVLAAAAKARVEASASALSVTAAQPEVLADGELERRSSEPCAMAELAPVSVETVATASIFPSNAAPSRISDISQDLGSQAAAPAGGGAERQSRGRFLPRKRRRQSASFCRGNG